MAKVIMEWCLFNKEQIYIENMEKDEYEKKYKGKLRCIHGCNARIKYTERKNGIKFYSTWNKEGNKHSETCEFHVKYKGKQGRKKLRAEEEKRTVSDIQIQNAIDRKINNLKKEFKETNGGKENQGTNKVYNTGESTVKVSLEKNDVGGGNSGRENVTSINASFINSTYVERRKCVYGMIKNVQYNYSDNKELYGYLNLKNDKYQVSVYFPKAFYSNEYLKEDDFKSIMDILVDEINERGKECMVVCFGEIRYKEKSKDKFNINVISPNHIKINEMSLNQIFTRRLVNQVDYSIK